MSKQQQTAQWSRQTISPTHTPDLQLGLWTFSTSATEIKRGTGFILTERNKTNIDMESVCAPYIPASETLLWSKAHVEPPEESRWWRRERWTSPPPRPTAGMCRTYRIEPEYTEQYWRSEYPAERDRNQDIIIHSEQSIISHLTFQICTCTDTHQTLLYKHLLLNSKCVFNGKILMSLNWEKWF